MTDDASVEVAGEDAGGIAVPMPNAADTPSAVPPAAMPQARTSIPQGTTFTIRKVPPPTVRERQARRDAMERAIKFGAAPYRNGEGKARYVFFKEANNAPVEAWRRDREAKRGYRRTQQARKAAGQMAWHPEDQIELAKRLGVIYHREGRSVEGAAERGLYDAIWRYEHVWDSFTVPRRFGLDIIETGRIAAVAEEEARKLQAEDHKAKGGFWVRDRKNNGLIFVVPNPDPEMLVNEEIEAAGGADPIAGDADIESAFDGYLPEDARLVPVGSAVPDEKTKELSANEEKSEALAGVQGDIVGLAREGTSAQRVRDVYRKQIKKASDDLMRKYLAGGYDAQTAAQLARNKRDELLTDARKQGTRLAREITEALKMGSPELEGLQTHYASKIFNKPFEQLTRADQVGIWEEIIRASGRDRRSVSKIADGLGKAGRALWVLSAAISAYNVLTADDKVKALAKEGATLGGGFAGSALGGVVGAATIGLLVGGPAGAAIGVLVGGFAGAMGVDIAFDAMLEDN